MWHLPLLFIAGTSQAHIPLAPFLLSVAAMSVVFAWMVDRTAGSVVVALLLHTGINFWPSIIPVLPTGEGHRPYGLLVAMLVLVALGLLVQPKLADPRSGAFVNPCARAGDPGPGAFRQWVQCISASRSTRVRRPPAA